MELQNKYNSVDITKMLMAFFVVASHTNSVCPAEYPPIMNYIFETVVPFFFVVSGFFLQNKIIRKNDTFGVLKSNFKKNFRLYTLWLLIYSPIVINRYCYNDRGFFGDTAAYLHSILILGDTDFAWPLWYMLALLVAVALIYGLKKLGFSLIKIWIISMIFMLIGYLFKHGIDSQDPTINKICNWHASIFHYHDRNGLYRGFAMVVTGMLLRQYYNKINKGIITGLSCICVAFTLIHFDMPFHQFFSGTGIFLLATSIKLKDNPLWAKLRSHSTWIYFMHMYIIYALALTFAPKITTLPLIVATVFAIFTTTWAIAAIINYIRNKKAHWLSNLIE